MSRFAYLNGPYALEEELYTAMQLVSVVLYGVPDTPNGSTDADMIEKHFQNLAEVGLDSSQRLGRSLTEHAKPRPLRVISIRSGQNMSS